MKKLLLILIVVMPLHNAQAQETSIDKYHSGFIAYIDTTKGILNQTEKSFGYLITLTDSSFFSPESSKYDIAFPLSQVAEMDNKGHWKLSLKPGYYYLEIAQGAKTYQTLTGKTYMIAFLHKEFIISKK